MVTGNSKNEIKIMACRNLCLVFRIFEKDSNIGQSGEAEGELSFKSYGFHCSESQEVDKAASNQGKLYGVSPLPRVE